RRRQRGSSGSSSRQVIPPVARKAWRLETRGGRPQARREERTSVGGSRSGATAPAVAEDGDRALARSTGSGARGPTARTKARGIRRASPSTWSLRATENSAGSAAVSARARTTWSDSRCNNVAIFGAAGDDGQRSSPRRHGEQHDDCNDTDKTLPHGSSWGRWRRRFLVAWGLRLVQRFATICTRRSRKLRPSERPGCAAGVVHAGAR